MSWEAANVPRASGGDATSAIPHQRNSKRDEIQGVNSETVEAALSRLSKAYNTSMECIGTMHKTDQMIIRQQEHIESGEAQAAASLKHVAIAARQALEMSVLLDPLIIPHAPTLHQYMLELSKPQDQTLNYQKWSSVRENRRASPVISSAAHRSTLTQLAYLSLINYSDLLLSCCLCCTSAEAVDRGKILDRHVVPKLQSLQRQSDQRALQQASKAHKKPDDLHASSCCCWQTELPEETLQLAVAALCDASYLQHTSDPSLWLKLATASKSLERIVSRRNNDISVVRTYHQRLQQYALERGNLALPSHMPPNRTVVRALDELYQEPKPTQYQSSLPTVDQSNSTKTIDLPRYSWATLGRMLLRACRGEDLAIAATSDGTHPIRRYHNIEQTHGTQHFGSPRIALRLSPILMLPRKELGHICHYLDSFSMWQLQATCRAFSISLLSAEAPTRDVAGGAKPQRLHDIENRSWTENESIEPLRFDVHLPPGGNDDVTQIVDHGATEPSAAHPHPPPCTSRQSSRSSRRLLSQQITSEKKQDREGNRKSFDYCFLATTLSCTKDELQVSARKLYGKRHLAHLYEGNSTDSFSPTNANCLEASSDIVRGSQTVSESRLSDASLSAFVNRWSFKNAGAVDIIEEFLAHVSINVGQVFSNEAAVAGTTELSSCLLSCFETLLHRRSTQGRTAPLFYQSSSHTGSFSRSFQLYSMELLYAELLFRECDRSTSGAVGIDHEENLVFTAVSSLTNACTELEQDLTDSTTRQAMPEAEFRQMQARLYWLGACFFSWKSKLVPDVYASIEAEKEGTYFIEGAIECFHGPALQQKVIETPHLLSLGRQESYWGQISLLTLSRFKDEMEASSIVSSAREQFQELLSQMKRDEDEGTLDVEAFARIGESLLRRYSAPYGDPDSKLNELVDNFLSLHGSDIVPRESTGPIDDKSSKVDLLPLLPLSLQAMQNLPNPSTLSMLFMCLSMEMTNGLAVVKILMSLILTTVDMHDSALYDHCLLRASRRSKSGHKTEEAIDDDPMMRRVLNGSTHWNGDEKEVTQYYNAFRFFFARLSRSLFDLISDEDRSEFVKSNGFRRVLDVSLTFSNKWCQSTSRFFSTSTNAVDKDIFESVSSLIDRCADALGGPMTLQRILVKGGARIIVSQTELLKKMTGLLASGSTPSDRSTMQLFCNQRAEYIAKVASVLGLLLSKNLGSVKDFALSKNRFLFGDDDASKVSRDEEVLFLQAVTWLGEFCTDAFEKGQRMIRESICPPYKRPLVSTLRIPIATLIVGLCGSAATSRRSVRQSEDPLDLAEFFDSDSSVCDWTFDDENASDDNPDFQKRELLRVFCHAVHCIGVTLDAVDGKSSLINLIESACGSRNGPPLTLVCTRVLNFFSDALLLVYGSEGGEKVDMELLWVEEYPYRTQDIGEFLDGLLHKIYRLLYGFVLVGERDHLQNSGKDLVHGLGSISEVSKRRFRPESTAAAAQLYRCTVRAYAGGRRTPPKAALEVVFAALPPQREDQRSLALKRFIFSGKKHHLGLSSIQTLVTKTNERESAFSEIKDCLAGNQSPSENAPASLHESEAMRVRRGLLSQLASGPLPSISADVKQKADAASRDEREQTLYMEEEISRKFNAIFDDICLGDASNCESWYRASQCLSMKAEIIADRLGLTLGFGRIKNFSVPSHRLSRERGMAIEKLKKTQERDETEAQKNCVTLLGSDLSVFVDIPWSSYSSLRECAARVQQSLQDPEALTTSQRATSLAVVHQIQSWLTKGDHLRWQEAWGGIYVHALRNMSLRFLSVALYTAHLQSRKEQRYDNLKSEICEAMGVALYSDLMASQRYGWPIGHTTTSEKRRFAETALECFGAAIKFLESSSQQKDGPQERSTWDLLFMIGKCNEKIAFSLRQETYFGQTVRLFEKHMQSALKSYSESLKQAKSIEDDGCQLADQAGGSSHGSTEVLYRLHASRLKILLHAVTKSFDELDYAEEEALRLTERHWFCQPESNPMTAQPKDLRDRVWDVFADVVEGLAECRQLQPFFHRSVYRHAQALMWAPAINDPRSCVGSMSTIPATRSFVIRGLNNSTPAAVSAGVLMSKLFDKKRSQLCAVWVTTSSISSPFQVLNSSIRKYDSLRGKYIFAYLEAMQICNRQGEIETFMKWAYSSIRDLPSYFQASAKNGGGRPAGSHVHDPLLILDKPTSSSLSSQGFLISSKRLANSRLSNVLLTEMSKKLGERADCLSGDFAKHAEQYLKHAYACFLRLNCSLEDLQMISAFKYGGNSVNEVEALCQGYLHFTLHNKMSSQLDSGDWSNGSNGEKLLFMAAVEKCKQLFPSLSSTFFSKKGENKSKEGNRQKRKESSVDLSSPASPSVHGTKKISFEVAIPKGLTTGDTFLTSVNVGNADPIKVKLTVPIGNQSTLRFQLDVPKSSTRKCTKKIKLSL